MEPNEAQTAPKRGTGGSSTVPVGPSEAQINSSTPQVKPNGAQMEPSGVQMELKWGSKSLRSPFQNQLCDHFDCSEAACALRHAIWTEISSQVGIDSGITCAQHRSNKAAGCFAKYCVLPEENCVFYCKTTSTLGTLLTMPT